MRVRDTMVAVTIAAAVSIVGGVAVWASDTPVPPVSRIEVVLANTYKSQVSALIEEFAQAGMANVHFQCIETRQSGGRVLLTIDFGSTKD